MLGELGHLRRWDGVVDREGRESQVLMDQKKENGERWSGTGDGKAKEEHKKGQKQKM